MYDALCSELNAIFARVRVVTPLQFSFDDELITVAPLKAQQYQRNGPLAALIQSLRDTLYHRCYTRAALVCAPHQALVPDPEFVARLAQANNSQERQDQGWRVYHVAAHGRLLVEKGGRCCDIDVGRFTADESGAAIAVGAMGSVQVLREGSHHALGFYFVYSETLPDTFEHASLVRIYFNVSSSTAPALLDYLTLWLNRYQVPFSFKCLNQLSLYGRADSAVLYLARRYFAIAADIIDHSPVVLESDVPLFTKPLLDGVGLAEDPDNGESFGSHRCLLLATGIVDAWAQGDHTSAGRFNAFARRFHSAGLNLHQPYLNPGSVDLFTRRGPVGIAV